MARRPFFSSFSLFCSRVCADNNAVIFAPTSLMCFLVQVAMHWISFSLQLQRMQEH